MITKRAEVERLKEIALSTPKPSCGGHTNVRGETVSSTQPHQYRHI